MDTAQAQRIAKEVAKALKQKTGKELSEIICGPINLDGLEMKSGTIVLKKDDPIKYDPVMKPLHYNKHPSGIECIQITEHMGFCLGNAMKYIWRADLKNGVEDLNKAIWYIQREISKRTPKENSNDTPRNT